MASGNAVKIGKENISYVNAELVNVDDSNDVQLETAEDEYSVAYANEAHTVFVQQGQYVIPVDGHAVVLQGDQGDFEYIINNIDEELQNTDETEQSVGQQVIYYASELTDQLQIFEDRKDIAESIEGVDESIMVEESIMQTEIPLSKQIKLEQNCIEDRRIQQENYSVENNFVQMQEEIGFEKVILADGSDHRQQSQYQFAILKNGKLHLQTLDFVDATADSHFNALENHDQHQQLQEQLAAFQQSINMEDTSACTSTVDLGKITGRNLITGQTVTLDSYFDKLQRRLATVDVAEQDFTYNAKKKRRNSFLEEQKDLRKDVSSDNSVDNSFVNKKVVVGKTSSGKKIVGKILRIHTTRGDSDSSSCEKGKKEMLQNGIKQTTVASKEVMLTSAPANERKSESTAVIKSINKELLSTEWDDKNVEAPQLLQPHIIIKKHVVTRENFDYNIGKTLAGLMGLETVQRRLQDKNLVVKLVEKVYDHNTDAFNRTVSYVYGHMELIQLEKESPENQQWAFVLHNESNVSAAMDEDDSSERTAENAAYGSVEAVPPSTERDNEIMTYTARTARLTENDETRDDEGTDGIKDVSLELEDPWTKYNETISLAIIITVDKTGKKSTRVNLSPQQPESRCHVCSKEFKSTLQMRKHLNNVHLCEKSAKCEFCGKNFANQIVLQRHQKIHTGERWYQCPRCSKSFNTAGSLKRHLTVHDPSLRPLECSVCVQRFTDESSLRKHLLIHTGIRAYACEICNRAFVNQGDLNFHRRIHDPVKQFSCEVCGREFSRHSNLMRHAEIHRGVGALHRCDICGCSYSFVSSLTRHIVQKHIGQQQ